MNQIDSKSVQFLNAVRYYGGEANISEIRKMAGLSRSEVNYRFRKLAEMDLIEITTTDSPGDLPDRKVAHLTGKARRELERGLGSSTTAGLVISDDPETNEVSRERFREMEEKLDELTTAQKAAAFDSREEDVVTQDEFSEFENYVYEWHEAAEIYMKTIRSVIEKYVPGVSDLSKYFNEIDESVNH